MHPPFVLEHRTREVGLMRDSVHKVAGLLCLHLHLTCSVNCPAFAVCSYLTGRGGRRAEGHRRTIRTTERQRENEEEGDAILQLLLGNVHWVGLQCHNETPELSFLLIPSFLQQAAALLQHQYLNPSLGHA